MLLDLGETFHKASPIAYRQAPACLIHLASLWNIRIAPCSHPGLRPKKPSYIAAKTEDILQSLGSLKPRPLKHGHASTPTLSSPDPADPCPIQTPKLEKKINPTSDPTKGEQKPQLWWTRMLCGSCAQSFVILYDESDSSYPF